MLALSFARCRGASLEIPLLCQLVSGWFNPSLPPRFENEERGQLGWEGRGGLEPLAPRAPIPTVFGTEPPHQHVPGITIMPQAPSHLKSTHSSFTELVSLP